LGQKITLSSVPADNGKKVNLRDNDAFYVYLNLEKGSEKISERHKLILGDFRMT
jgi:hypothetical protein